MRISKAVFRYIEHEMFQYEDSKKLIEDEKERILEGSPLPPDGQPRSNENSAPTEKKSMKLLTSVSLLRTESTINAIERSLKRLESNHNAIFELKYKQKIPWQQVCYEIPISQATYFRARKELVEMVGYELGLIT